jgi:hypothetical protein
MVASHDVIDQIVKIILKYVDRKTAIKMAREIHNRVHGNQSVTETFSRIVTKLSRIE